MAGSLFSWYCIFDYGVSDFAFTLPRDNLDIDMLPAMGCVQLTVGFMCYTIAARHILAAQVALFALIETILSPIWVWIGIGETPSGLSLAGIAIVLISITVYSVVELSKEQGFI